MPRNEEYDWIFDYTLQFLESDKFDSAVMDFVDEKCFLFDDEDENKLVYTEIHKDFCDRIEELINENLGEVGITSEKFLEACERARSERDINATVYERLIAMDDFQTFKKIMVKRNTELQLESLRYMAQMQRSGSDKASDGKDGEGDRLESLLSPEELKALKELELMDINRQLQDDELQDLLFQSLMEMEIIHRQEELEHAELERALMLSLAAEEERLQALLEEEQSRQPAADAKPVRAELTAPTVKQSSKDETPAETKSSAAIDDVKATAQSFAEGKAVAAAPAPTLSAGSSPGGAAHAHNQPSPKKIGAVHSNSGITITNPDAFADVKPLKMKGFAPLPSIKPTSAEDAALKAAEELAEKKRQVEDAMRKASQQLAGQRRNEEELRQQAAVVDPTEAERRAKHLKEQRDLLLAKKKAERDARVAAEEEKKRRAASSGQPPSPDAKSSPSKSFLNSLDNKGAGDSKDGPSAEELAEMRRATMRMALARRMKIDLIESEEAKIAEMQEAQFAEYDRKLQQVEQMREDNRKREYILAKQLAKQQEQIARNVKLSAQAIGGDGV